MRSGRSRECLAPISSLETARRSSCSTDAEGRYAIRTLKPGPVPGPDGSSQAPHLAVSVFARGLLDRVVTRVYFADEAAVQGLAPATATLTVRMRSGEPWTLSLHPGAAGVIARVSGRPGGFLVAGDTGQRLEAAFRKAVTEPTPSKKP